METSTKIYGMRIDTLLSLTNPKFIQKEPNVNQAPKKLGTKRKSCNIVQNPNILNKPLEVHQTNINILSATIGHQSNDLLTNILNSRDSALAFPDKSTTFWNSNSYDEQDQDYNYVAYVDDVKKPGAFRSSLETYTISACPIENNFAVTTVNLIDDEDDVVMGETEISHSKSFAQSTLVNDSGFNELTYSDLEDDIDMKVDQSDSNSFTNSIHDESEEYSSMMPSTCKKFEYSYQPQEWIENHWAGPSYWKFHQNHLCESNLDRSKLKKANSGREIYFEDVFRKRNNNNDCLVRALTEPLHLIRNNIKFRRQTLPVDYIIPSNFTDHFETSQNLDIDTPIFNEIHDPTQSFNNSENFNLSQEDMQSTQDDFEVPSQEENSQQNLSSKIAKIQLKTICKKPTDIRIIKNMTITVLESEKKFNGLNDILFSEIVRKSLKMLEETETRESTALILQAILHLTNEKIIEINSEFGNVDDFYIRIK